MNAKGSVFKYPDNVDTDVIIPARHLNTQDPKELASHCMEDIDKDFVRNVRDGDVMVGGWNFGCGSSREHAPLCIKTAGISVVIAKSFARIFYRNSINIGLPIMECPEAVDAIHAGDNVTVDFDTGVITDVTTGKVFQAEPFPPFIQKIIAVGGNPHSRELAKELGATHTMNRKECDEVAAVRGLANGGVNYSIDTTGVGECVRKSLAMCDFDGTCVVVGATGDLTINVQAALMGDGKSLIGVLEGDSVPKDFIPKLVEYYHDGRFPIDRLMKVYPFEKINEAIYETHAGKCIKAVLKME